MADGKLTLGAVAFHVSRSRFVIEVAGAMLRMLGICAPIRSLALEFAARLPRNSATGPTNLWPCDGKLNRCFCRRGQQLLSGIAHESGGHSYA